MRTPDSVGDSLTFLLGKLGGIATSRFADRLAERGLRPRHCAVLELAGATPLSQLDLANRIGVTPSVVVDMLDELEGLEAIRRVQDSADRRRRVIELTETGQDLRHYAGRCAHEVDTSLLTGLTPEDRQALRDLLGQLTGLIY